MRMITYKPKTCSTLAIGEGAALATQQQLVKELDVDKGEELLEERLYVVQHLNINQKSSRCP